ncbi:WGR domain-containing protein [Rhizobium sp. BK251]|uniref:WGR domain-containing protein n=1 Tax=Rhizobium sp. BK251 TaxID=2512125 RepID=UPI001052486A|nr:WGR domain-containing protein [Rhizobium sp. BK251]TCL71281.1 putative DNA-binding WGR domain protein [Rhizobium sp. BK251]
MTTGSNDLLLTRIDPACNMARFYYLSVEPSLFGGCSLVRSWGRIGTRGRIRVELYQRLAEAKHRFGELAAAKRRRGYC